MGPIAKTSFSNPLPRDNIDSEELYIILNVPLGVVDLSTIKINGRGGGLYVPFPCFSAKGPIILLI